MGEAQVPLIRGITGGRGFSLSGGFTAAQTKAHDWSAPRARGRVPSPAGRTRVGVRGDGDRGARWRGRGRGRAGRASAAEAGGGARRAARPGLGRRWAPPRPATQAEGLRHGPGGTMAAAATPAAAASSEAPAATATAEPAAGDEDSREVRVLQSLRGKICKRGPDRGAPPAAAEGYRARGGGGRRGRSARALARLEGVCLGRCRLRGRRGPGLPSGASGSRARPRSALGRGSRGAGRGARELPAALRRRPPGGRAPAAAPKWGPGRNYGEARPEEEGRGLPSSWGPEPLEVERGAQSW